MSQRPRTRHRRQLTQRFAARVHAQLRHPAGRAGARRGQPRSGTPTASEYLDFVGGIAVNALGHAHPAVVEAVSPQIATLGHISNLFLPSRRSRSPSGCSSCSAGAGRVFFSNSGAEANEAAFKIGRQVRRGARPRYIVATEGGFHGRTMGALALTGKPANREPFVPLPGRRHASSRTATRRRCARRSPTRPRAVFIEPIQGESGVVPPPAGYLRGGPRDLRATGALLVARRDPDRRSAAPGTGSRTRRDGRRRPTSSRWPRGSAAACRSAPASLRRRRRRLFARATTARRSAATRSRAPPRSPCSTRSRRDGLLDHVKRSARGCATASRPSATRCSRGPRARAAGWVSCSPSRCAAGAQAAARTPVSWSTRVRRTWYGSRRR